MSNALALNPKVTILPPISEAKKLGPVQKVQKLKFVKAMKDNEREALIDRTTKLGSAMAMHVKSGLAIGQFLSEIREITTPYRGYGKYLRQFNIAEKTAERWVRGYQAAAKFLPLPVVEEMAARGVKITGYSPDEKPLGILTDIVRDNRPSRAAFEDRQAAKEYVDKILQTVKEKRSRIRKLAAKKEVEHGEPKELRGNVIRVFFRNLNRLPGGPKRQQAWVEDVIGEIMTAAGITSKRSFDPIAVPDEHRLKQVGRPRIVDGKEKEEEATAATAS